MAEEREAGTPGRAVEGSGPAAGAGSAAGHKAPNYILIWVYLLILTVAEVAVAFVSQLPETWLILILLALALWKAALVAMYYMHLRYEPPRLVVLVLAPLPAAILLALTIVTMEGF